MYLFLALIAAIAFAFGSMVFKRAYDEGAGVAHTVVVNNVILALVFLPLLLLESRPIPWHDWHMPVLTGAAFATGHLLNAIALRVGDVSIVTPLLGSKVIFVALLAGLAFGSALSTNQWLAAALATAGVFLMGITDFKPGRRAGLTTVLALGCAAGFSLTDVLIQTWANNFGVMSFLSLQFVALAICSVAMTPFFGGLKSLRAPRKAWRWIFAAAGFSGLQAILITAAIGIWQDAASVNVVYATRGLWSIVLVWFVGHWLKNTERHTAGGRSMLLRAAGGSLILLSVILAVKK